MHIKVVHSLVYLPYDRSNGFFKDLVVSMPMLLCLYLQSSKKF